MNYIVFDLEFNQAINIKNSTKNDCPFEIIQIGAIKLDQNFNTISTFNTLVKPKIYTKIHPFVKELTKITEDELNAAKPFVKAFEDFLEFISDNKTIFCIWGKGDLKELYRNISYYKLDHTFIPKEYIDIQHYASKYLNTPNKNKISLINAVSLLSIPMNIQFHDAYNDAYYTGKILKKINNQLIKPQIYNPSQIRNKNKYRRNNKKKKIETIKLINQFEKMYGRKMNTEEISIIILSYKMGLTHQFLKLEDEKLN